MVKNPNCMARGDFTSLAENLNLGLPTKTPARGQGETSGLHEQRSTTLP